ncbi:MAG: hypothetical protein KF905_14580 [Flavobacteriales bacterium]|nr:hypothetical protein [Flavobacteriales bacterium]
MYLPALLIALSVMACKTREATTSTPESSGPNAVYGGTGRVDSLFLSLERTPCFGMCKAYRIHVYRSGYATFEGVSNVEKEGMHEGRVGADTLAQLLKDAERLGFFALNDVYDGQVTDLPSTTIRIVANGKDKRVMARVGTPPNFKALAEGIDELLLPMAWKPVAAKH